MFPSDFRAIVSSNGLTAKGGVSELLHDTARLLGRRRIEGTRVGIIPNAREEIRDDLVEVATKRWQSVGAETTMIDLRDDGATVRQQIESVEVVYLEGGNPMLLMHRLRRRELTGPDSPLFQKVWVGSSAGGVILGQDLLGFPVFQVLNWRDNTRPWFWKYWEPRAIGITRKVIFPHYEDKYAGLVGLLRRLGKDVITLRNGEHRVLEP